MAGLSMIAVGFSLPMLSTSAAAQQAENTDIEEVVVLGTRRKGRTIADSSVPIDVLGADEFESMGITETNQLLATLLPSFNFPQPSITDATDQIRPAQLRGLAPDHTLVLINGKRRHKSALLNLNGSVGRGSQAVDINQIPANAIKSIQVLRDGAAAQYGSDAIAGVINIILKDAPDGVSFSATYGLNATTLDGVNKVGSVQAVDNGDGTQGVSVTESDDEVTRTDGETLTIRGNAGFALGDGGFFNASLEYRDRNPTNRSGYDVRQQYALIDGQLDPRELTFDRFNHRFGNAEVEDITAVINAGVPISDTLEGYLFGTYGRRDGNSAGFYRRSQDSRNITEVYPDGFLPLITTVTNDFSIASGVRGEISGWDADLSVVYGEDEIDFGVTNSLNRSYGPDSPTTFDAGTLVNDHFVVNADFSRLYDIADMPVNVAFGAEYRKEGYQIIQGEPASLPNGPGVGTFGGAAGSQVFPGFTPESEVDGSRNNIGVYLELDTDVTQAWNVSAAGRFEDYSDFGSNASWKVASRYTVSDTFTLRGSVQTGFRAPSLGQQFFQSIATVFVDAVPFETGTFRPDSDVAIALGAPGLDSESSFGFSAGFAWQPVEGLNLTVDYFNIEIDDRIVLSENLSGAEVEAVLSAAGVNATQGRFFLNGADTKTQGFDVVATYDWEIGDYGLLKLNAAFNYTDTEVEALDVPLTINVGADAIFSQREARRFELGSPETKLNLSATWLYGDLRVTARTNRYGETISPAANPAEDLPIGPSWITDLEVQYDVTENVYFALGANNIFDVYPGTNIEFDNANGFTSGTFDRIFPYSGFSPYGFSGRYVYGRVGVTF
jgi:iron complex outermembrane receptor protein